MKPINLILICAFVGFMAWWGGCTVGHKTGRAECRAFVKDSTVLVYDTNVVEAIISVTSPIRSERLPVPQVIDTVALITDYFSRYTFEEEYRDSSVAIRLRPVISENNLDSLNLSYQLLRPQEVNYFSAEPRAEIFAGMQVSEVFLGPSVQYKQGRWLFGAAYNFADQPGKIQLQASYRLFELK